MLTPAITALLNDAAEHLRQKRPANAHRLLAIADRAAQRDRTISAERRDAISAARMLAVLAIN